MGDIAHALRVRLEVIIAPLEHDAKVAVLDWVEKVLDTDLSDDDNIEAGLLAGVVEGSILITGVEGGQVMFRLSDEAKQEIYKQMMERPELRHMLKSMVGGAAVDEPEQPQ